MPKLDTYDRFLGRHPVTGSVANALAHAGVKAPHTGQPLSEALLAGIAGGICFGYFYFHYEGHAPQVNIVTRYSFDEYGYSPLVDRLGVGRDVIQTTAEKKARENLVAQLEAGEAPIVWADVLSFSYETSELGEDMWMVTPVIVYSYDDESALLADRSRAPIEVPAHVLDRARGRVKKERFRIVTLETPDLDRLPEAVSAGIASCVSLYTEKPPKGSGRSWGLRGFDRFIEVLTKPTAKGSWAKALDGAADAYAGLTTAYKYALLFWKDESESADRDLYAAFLREAAEVLDRPALTEVAEHYDRAAEAWRHLGAALLPDDVPLLRETRELLLERHRRFLDSGTQALDDLEATDERLSSLRGESLSEREIESIYSSVADGVRTIRDIESEAVSALTHAMK